LGKKGIFRTKEIVKRGEETFEIEGYEHTRPVKPPYSNSQLIRVAIYNDDITVSSPPPAISFMVNSVVNS
jgi:hypothetical protein